MYTWNTRVLYSQLAPNGRLSLIALLDLFQDVATLHAEDAGDGLLVIYANITKYPPEELFDEDEEVFDEDDDLLDDDDYGDIADCYQTCENYRPVSEEDWRCVNFCPHCGSCMDDAA